MIARSFKRFFFHPLSAFFVPSAAAHIVLVAAMAWFVPANPLPYIIVFSFHAGPEYFGTRAALFSMSAVGFVITVVNWLLAWVILKRSMKLTGVLALATVFVAVMSWIIFFGFIRFNNVF